MSIATLNPTATKSKNDFVYNPASQLTTDQFMQLFLKQLEMQDPTNPMDTDKMLSQTAQLATMEMNTKMKDTLDNLSKSLQYTTQMNTISAIGKMADTGNRDIVVTSEDKSKNIDLYFSDDIQNGEVFIKDKQGNVIKSFSINNRKKGILNFDWDLTDSNGKRVPNDTYKVTATYYNDKGDKKTTTYGVYPVEAIKFENGKALAKLGNSYIPFDSIKEIY